MTKENVTRLSIARTAGQQGIAEMRRYQTSMKVKVGNPGAGQRGSRTLRLILENGTFARIERNAAMMAGLEIGAYYELSALVTERTNLRGAKSFVVNEVMEANICEAFTPAELIISYVAEPSVTMPNNSLGLA